MTTTQTTGDEARRGDVLASRVRGMIGERRAKSGELALALGMSRSAFSRRLAAETDFTPNEVQALAAILLTTEEYLYGFSDLRDAPSRPTPWYFLTDVTDDGVVVDLDVWRRARRARRRTYAPPQRLADVIALADRRAS